MSADKRFYSFVIPSIGAMLVTGLYFIVDGIFVGQGVGADALGMINVATPFISVLTSVAMMITMGGASLSAIAFGRGEKQRANNIFLLSCLLVVFFTLIMMVLAVLFSQDIVRFLGATPSFVEGSATYLKYYILFGIFYCGAMLLAAFIRNDGNPRLAFWGMILGAASNIILDYIFIFPLGMGVKGAAIASGLGQVFSCLALLTHFFGKKGELRLGLPKISRTLAFEIMKIGSPEFVTHMSQPVITFCYNLMIVGIFGELGISAFSIVSYLLWFVLYIFMGIAQGAQPLLSLSYGEGEFEQERYYLRKTLRLGFGVALFVYLGFLLFSDQIISVFSKDPIIMELTRQCLTVYGLSFGFWVFNVVYTTYYLSTARTKSAMQITVLRSLVLNSACIFLLPTLFGEGAIWTGIIVAEGLITLFILLKVQKSKAKCV